MSLLLFSGGYDSTLILYDMLEAQYSNNCNHCGDFQNTTKSETKPLDVRTISFNHPNIGDRHESRLARERIIDWFREHKQWTFEHLEITIEASGFDIPPGCLCGLTQPGIWLQSLTYLRNFENLIIGYIKGDDIWHRWAFVQHAFTNLQGIRDGSGALLTPLEWTDKITVVKRMRTLGLDKLCWYCETPQKFNTTCGKCGSCIRQWQAEAIIKAEKILDTQVEITKVSKRKK